MDLTDTFNNYALVGIVNSKKIMRSIVLFLSIGCANPSTQVPKYSEFKPFDLHRNDAAPPCPWAVKMNKITAFDTMTITTWFLNAVLVGFILSLDADCICRDLKYTKDLLLYIISIYLCFLLIITSYIFVVCAIHFFETQTGVPVLFDTLSYF